LVQKFGANVRFNGFSARKPPVCFPPQIAKLGRAYLRFPNRCFRGNLFLTWIGRNL
jgi:hypothetical protein